MKVKDIIATLSKFNDQEEELIITWWEKDMIEDWLDTKISNEHWLNAEDDLMSSDWSDADEQIRYSIEESMKEDAQPLIIIGKHSPQNKVATTKER